jgi:type II secretion system protein G
MKIKRFGRQGFTLMELIVAMALLGILSVMVLGSYTATQRKKNDIKRKSDLSQMGKALELYYQDFERYPSATGNQMNACGATGSSTCTWGTSRMENQSTGVIYMAKLPKDPLGGQTYYYMSDATGTYYKIYAKLENTDDQDAYAGAYADPLSPDCSTSATTVGCNFGVSSTNVSLN